MQSTSAEPPHTDPDPIAGLLAAVKLGQTLADQARAELKAATPLLIDAIRHQSGQSVKIEALLWSVWNDNHQVNLCDAVAGLDTKLTRAAMVMISARAYCGGDADDLLKKIIDQSGIQQPA